VSRFLKFRNKENRYFHVVNLEPEKSNEMAKTGIYRIGFAEQNEIDDAWQQQEEQQQERGLRPGLTVMHWFSAFDQREAVMNEELVEDETGIRFETTLDFAVRRDADITLAKKYMRRPVVMHVVAVDQNEYKVGTKSYPVRMRTNNDYAGIDTREIHITVSYKSRNGVMNG